MKLVENILTRNPCYTAGRKITVKGLMLHSVGCPQPKASAFINSWNSPSHDTSCVHGFIDGNDGTVYQTLPWNHRGWHCGSGSKGSGNNTHIGVEMCEPACIRRTQPGHCQQPRRPGAFVGATWDGIYHGWFPQSGQGGNGQCILRHRRIHKDYGECRGNSGADEGLYQSEKPEGGAVCP